MTEGYNSSWADHFFLKLGGSPLDLSKGMFFRN